MYLTLQAQQMNTARVTEFLLVFLTRSQILTEGLYTGRELMKHVMGERSQLQRRGDLFKDENT